MLLAEVEEGVEGRVTAPNNYNLLLQGRRFIRHTKALLDVSVGKVRNAVEDLIGELSLRTRPNTAREERIVRRPRARGVNDGASDNRMLLLLPDFICVYCGVANSSISILLVVVNIADIKRQRLTADSLHLVAVQSANAHNFSVEDDGIADRGVARERLQVLLDDVTAERQRKGAGGLPPSRLLKQGAGGGADVASPRREQANMRPLANVARDARAGLEQNEGQLSADALGGRRQSHRTSADNQNGQVNVRHLFLFCFPLLIVIRHNMFAWRCLRFFNLLGFATHSTQTNTDVTKGGV